MPRPTRRDLAFALGGVALGALAGFLAARSISPASLVSVTTVERPSSSPDPATPSSASAPGLAALPPPAGSPPPTPLTPSPLLPLADVLEADVGLAASIDTAFEVHLVKADGTPAEAFDVLVAPHGVTTPEERLPTGGTDSRGVARIPLPRGGRYDIGVEDGLFAATALDTAALPQKTTEVRLRLPEAARLEVLVDPDAVDHLCRLEFESADALGTPWPGGGPPKRLGLRCIVDKDGRVDSADGRTVELPRGVRFRVTGRLLGSKRRCTVEPGTIAAPGALRLSAGPETEVSPTSDSPASIVAHVSTRGMRVGIARAPVHFVVRTEGTPPEKDDAQVVLVDGSGEHTLRMRVPRGEAVTVTWSGEGVTEGNASVRAPVESDEDVVVEVECTSPAGVLEGIEVLDPAGALIPKEGRDGHWWQAWSGTDAPVLGDPAKVDDTGWKENLATWSGRTATITLGAWWTSRPTVLPVTGTAKVRLESGGLLLLHMKSPPPPSAGPIRIERMDGGVLIVQDPEYLFDRSSHAATPGGLCESVYPGTLLGPLPAGDVPLRVTLGGVEVGRVVAKVKAGEVTVLSLR